MHPYRRKLEDEGGFYTKMGKGTVHIDEQGKITPVSDEVVEPAYYTVGSTRKNEKRYENIKEAARNAYQRVEKGDIRKEVVLMVHFNTPNPQRILAQTIARCYKSDRGEVKLRVYALDRLKIVPDMDREEWKIFNEKNGFPESWFKKRKYKTKPNPEERTLKMDFPIHTITYNTTNPEEKRKIAGEVLRRMQNIQKEIDTKKLCSFHLDIRRFSNKRGDYTSIYQRMRVDDRSLNIFYHEFSHYLDDVTNYYSEYREIREKLIEKLKKTETILWYQKNSEESKKKYQSNKKKRSWERYYQRKHDQYHDYYMKPNEILARFFDAYFCYYYHPETSHYSFKKEEIQANTPLMKQLCQSI